MKRLIVIGLLLAMTACAGTAETRATNALAIACDSFATGLDQITPIRKAGKVSPDNVTRVDAAIRLVTPVCSSDAVVDPDTAIGVVREGIDLLKSVKSAL
jgi:hypothetical protein